MIHFEKWCLTTENAPNEAVLPADVCDMMFNVFRSATS